MNSNLVEVYSDALFNLCSEKDVLDTCKDDLMNIKKTFDDNDEIKRFMLWPQVSKEDKKNLLDKVFDSSNAININFLKVLLDKSRFAYFDQILDGFFDKYNVKNKIAKGVLTSARQFPEEDLSRIKAALSKALGKKVELDYRLDPELIGGFSVMIDGKIIDNSLKSRLLNLKSSLKKRGEL